MNNIVHRCRMDHLVVCASDLPAGVAWFENLGGVRLPKGGSHPLMGTHNHLSALSEDEFFEIIAIDPQAPGADRPRWFNLDSEIFQRQLQQGPKLTTWVMATDDLPATLAALEAQGIDAGTPVAQTRGDLHWQIALRDDGTLAYDGVFPILIQWPAGVNPVAQMQDQGLRLDKLQLQHPEAAVINTALRNLNASHLAECRIGEPKLQAQMSINGRSFEI